MGTPYTVTVTLSSVGTSRPVNLDWANGSVVGVLVLGASTGTTASLQITLDDIMQSSNPTWVSDPNFTAATSATSTVYQYTAPIAAIRLNSTTASGSSPLTLKVTQGSYF